MPEDKDRFKINGTRKDPPPREPPYKNNKLDWVAIIAFPTMVIMLVGIPFLAGPRVPHIKASQDCNYADR